MLHSQHTTVKARLSYVRPCEERKWGGRKREGGEREMEEEERKGERKGGEEKGTTVLIGWLAVLKHRNRFYE